ncbi:MAG: hypothetical protein ICV85_08605 [Tolypothrix sp. T3-bin4]|nr:hypothetical protein [Tolypothrix sp. T3-bin4]
MGSQDNSCPSIGNVSSLGLTLFSGKNILAIASLFRKTEVLLRTEVSLMQETYEKFEPI